MTTDLFTNSNNSSANQDQSQANANQSQDADNAVLAELVGPGKKFASIEALALGKKTSDEYIAKIQAENAGLRDELNRRTSTEEIIKQVRAELMQSQNGDNQAAGLDEATVAKIVQSQLSEAQQLALVEQNMESVRQAMLAQFQTEDAAKEAIYKKAAELGVPVDYLRNNAAQAPKAFLALMGVTGQQTKNAPASPVGDMQRSSQNSEAMPRGNDMKQVKEYYDNLRRTEPTKYWATSTQNEIWKLMSEGKYPVE